MRFAAWIAEHYPSPLDTLTRWFEDAQDKAASIGALLDVLPELDGSWHKLPDLDGKNRQKRSYIGEWVTDNDGTWPSITFTAIGRSKVPWNPRDLAFQEWRASSKNTPVSGDKQAEYRERAARFRVAADAKKAESDAQRLAGQEAAAKAAMEAWNAATACAGHSYLSAKGVQPFGLRIASKTSKALLWSDDKREWLETIVAQAGDLLVPVVDVTGKLWNLQRINAKGQKRFIMGGLKKGSFHKIDGTEPAWIAEGYATAATVHAATGAAVVVAFDAGNLAAVSAVLGERLNAVAADNDENNAGSKGAEAAGLPIAMPPTVGDDWNDHAARFGLESVAELLAHVTVPSAVPLPGEPKNPRLLLPIFSNLAGLERVELTGRDQVWFNRLSREAEPSTVAAVAWAICRKRAISLPVQMDPQDLIGRIESAAADRLHPDTVAAMKLALARWNSQRQARALAHVTISKDLLNRHIHQVYDELPTFTDDDYSGVILLWSPMGSGKTKRVGKPFAEWARSRGRFIATCHRRSLVGELAKVLGCDHYNDVTREIAWSVHSLATCLPSITKSSHAQIINECEFLFVDEIAQVLRFLESDKACRTEEGTNAHVYEALRSLVARAKCVIGADAGMDDRVVRFLEDCRPNEQFRIVEVRPSSLGLAAQYAYGADAVAAVYGEMCARLAEGQRIWVSCESEKRVAEVVKLLEKTGRRVLGLTASNKGNAEQSAFWSAPEAVSREYDAVVHSPVISSGLSIEHRGSGHFDHGFFIGGGHAITPADAAQMIRRVRYLRSWSIALVANTMRGLDDPESMLTGMEAAASIEGRPSNATGFDNFVAGIRSDNNNARSDFAAGLFWNLQNAKFKLTRLSLDSDSADSDLLKQLREELDQERQAAIISAHDLDEDEARRLRTAEKRTQSQSDALTKHAIRKALGIEQVTAEALEIWDDGRGVRRLDRFSSAVFGQAERHDDSEHMTQRRYSRARVTAYRILFEGIEVAPGLRVTDEMAEELISRVIEHRHLFAWLGIAPSRFGAFTGCDQDGIQKPFPRPKTPQKDVGEIFRAMGLVLKRRRNEWAGTKSYELTDAAFQEVEVWAKRRDSARSGVITLGKYTASGTVEGFRSPDDAFWLNIRRHLLENIQEHDMHSAKALVNASLKSRGLTYGAKVTAFWLRDVFSERLSA